MLVSGPYEEYREVNRQDEYLGFDDSCRRTRVIQQLEGWK